MSTRLQCQVGNDDKHVIQFGYIEINGLSVFTHFKSILGFRHCLFGEISTEGEMS
jgi:hypothetical protein